MRVNFFLRTSQRMPKLTMPTQKSFFSTSNQTCVCGLFSCLPSSCPAMNYQNWIVPDDNKLILAPYLGSSLTTIDDLFTFVGLKRNESLLDLGCGDGRIMIRALQQDASYVEGWELDENVYNLAHEHISVTISNMNNSESLQNRYKLNLGDCKKAIIQDFDIITMFLLPEGLKLLEPWLSFQRQTSKKNQRIVTLGWMIPGWKISKQTTFEGGTVAYCYQI